MDDLGHCERCGRAIEPGDVNLGDALYGRSLCWSPAKLRSCYRLAWERARPVVEAARVALTSIDRLIAADRAWTESDDTTSAQLHSFYDRANEENTAMLEVLRSRLAAFDGKAGTP